MYADSFLCMFVKIYIPEEVMGVAYPSSKASTTRLSLVFGVLF